MIEIQKNPRGRVVGGILDPAYERSYYTLIPCPQRGYEVDLEQHRSCECFGGIHMDPTTGTHYLYCLHRDS